MRAALISFLLLIPGLTTQAQNSIHCLPDKGVQIAQHFVNIEGEEMTHIEDIHYDREGRTVLRRMIQESSEMEKVYQNGKLAMIISTRKQMPDFYTEESYDSLMANASSVTDTALVISHYANGEMKEFRQPDGTITAFSFDGCKEELIYFTQKRDTFGLNHTTFENNLASKTEYTFLKPVETIITKTYLDYKFNQKGHWIERKMHTDGGVFIETRELTYY